MSTWFSLSALTFPLRILCQRLRVKRHRDSDKCSGRWQGTLSKGQGARRAGWSTPVLVGGYLAYRSPRLYLQSLPPVPAHYLSIDHQCSQWYFCHPTPCQCKAFLLKSATSVSAACGVETFQTEKGSSKLTAVVAPGDVREKQDWQSATFYWFKDMSSGANITNY